MKSITYHAEVGQVAVGGRIGIILADYLDQNGMEVSMRPSEFNILLPQDPDQGDHLLYNVFTDSLATVPQEVADFLLRLQAGGTILPDEEEGAALLSEHGFLVEPGQEQAALRRWFREKIYGGTDHLTLTVLTTYGCNLACPYCYQDDPRIDRAVPPMDAAMAERTVAWMTDQLERLQPRRLEVCFFGGEPLLNLDALRTIARGLRAATDRLAIEWYFTIVTNGVLLTPELVDELRPLGLDLAIVTLDGPRDVHDRQRPYSDGRGSYDRILANVAAAADRIRVALNGNYDTATLPRLPDLLRDLVDRGLRGRLAEVNFKPILGGCGPSSCPVRSMAEVPIDTHRQIRAMVNEYGFRDGYRFEGVAPCDVYRNNVWTVDPAGRVYSCPSAAGVEAFCLGTIDGPVRDKPDYAARSLDEGCAHCTHVTHCAGGCRWSSYLQDGDAGHLTCLHSYHDAIARMALTRSVAAEQPDP